MKDESFNQPQPTDPDSGGEEWVPKEKILELHPLITERMLKYWRESGKVQYRNIRNRTLYIESQVRAQHEHYLREKKRVRFQHVAKKITNIDWGLVILILVGGYLFTYFEPWKKNQVYTTELFWYPFALMLCLAVIYWLVRLIQFIRKRLPRKEKDKK